MITARVSVIAVLGYGCQLTKEVQEYLDQVVAFVQGKVNCVIILTGGYTDPKNAPHVSEAGMMESYLLKKGVTQEIILDVKARTTNENIDAIEAIMCQRGFASYAELVIFCDWAHKFKVMRVVKHTRTIPKCYPITHRITRGFIAIAKQLLIATPLCYVATYLPHIKKPFRRLEVLRKEWLAKKAA